MYLYILCLFTLQISEICNLFQRRKFQLNFFLSTFFCENSQWSFLSKLFLFDYSENLTAVFIIQKKICQNITILSVKTAEVFLVYQKLYLLFVAKKRIQLQLQSRRFLIWIKCRYFWGINIFCVNSRYNISIKMNW